MNKQEQRQDWLTVKQIANNKLSKKEKKLIVWRFFFPTYPYNVLRSVVLMIILAVLLALSLILSSLSIPIGFGIAIGFAYLPIMIAGWFFGPIIGLIFGAVADTLSWLIHGWIWYWLYAIDEPLVGLIAGLIAGLMTISLRFNKSIWINVVINQFFVVGFIAAAFAIVYTYTSPHNSYYQTMVSNWLINPVTNRNIQILVGVFLSAFTIIVEAIIFTKFKQHWNQKTLKAYLIFLYGSLACIFNTVLFAFILGPIAAIGYLEYITGHFPKALVKYGYMFYLLPRIVTECIKTPIYILLFTSLLYALNPIVIRNLNKLRNSWFAK